MDLPTFLNAINPELANTASENKSSENYTYLHQGLVIPSENEMKSKANNVNSSDKKAASPKYKEYMVEYGDKVIYYTITIDESYNGTNKGKVSTFSEFLNVMELEVSIIVTFVIYALIFFDDFELFFNQFLK